MVSGWVQRQTSHLHFLVVTHVQCSAVGSLVCGLWVESKANFSSPLVGSYMYGVVQCGELGLWPLGGIKGKLLISTFWLLHMYSVVQWGTWSVVSGWNQRQTSHLHFLVVTHVQCSAVGNLVCGLWVESKANFLFPFGSSFMNVVHYSTVCRIGSVIYWWVLFACEQFQRT